MDDISGSVTNVALVAGSVYITQLMIFSTGPFSQLGYNCGTAEVGGTAGQNFIGIYTADGQTQLAITGDLSSAGVTGNWTGAGTKATPCAGTIPATTPFLWAAVLANAITTLPSLRCSGNASGAGNIGPNAVERINILSTLQTSLPASFAPPTALSGTPLNIGIGLW